MTNNEINIAIAEACGAKRYHVDGAWTADYPPGLYIIVNQYGTVISSNHPNYTTDLNAMHEAEKTLNDKQVTWYMQKLTQIRYKAGISGMIGCMIDKIVFATARQRAEAFLRTLNKWKE